MFSSWVRNYSAYLISGQRMSGTGAERQDKHGGLTADLVFKYRNEGERLLKEPQL